MCTFVGGYYGYQLRSSGRCPNNTEIKSISECTRAAQFLILYDQSVSSDNLYKAPYDPPGCYYEGGSLKFNNYGGNYGYCSSDDKCLCKVPQSTTTTTTGTFG